MFTRGSTKWREDEEIQEGGWGREENQLGVNKKNYDTLYSNGLPRDRPAFPDWLIDKTRLPPSMSSREKPPVSPIHQWPQLGMALSIGTVREDEMRLSEEQQVDQEEVETN